MLYVWNGESVTVRVGGLVMCGVASVCVSVRVSVGDGNLCMCECNA